MKLGYADGTSGEAEADVTASEPGISAAPEPSPPALISPATTVATPASVTPAAAEASTDEGRANTALAVAVIAGVLALVGIGLALANKGGSGSTPGSTDAGANQNW